MNEWVSSAELARRCCVSRNAVKKAIQEQRINPSDVRRVGNNVMVRLAAGLSVLGHHAGPTAAPPAPTTAPAGGLFAWGTTTAAAPAPPDPEPAPAPGAPGELEQLLAREAAWIDTYAAFRRWITDGISLDLMRALPDPVSVGDVMVVTRDLLLQRLKPLDTLERRSRFG